MNLSPFDKLIITKPLSNKINGRVIGIKDEDNGTQTYLIQPLRVDFTPHKTGSRLMRVNSRDIENKTIKIEKHII